MFSPREILCEKEVLSAEQIKVKSKSHFFSKKDKKVFSKSRKIERFVGHENSYLRMILHLNHSEIHSHWLFGHFATFTPVIMLSFGDVTAAAQMNTRNTFRLIGLVYGQYCMIGWSGDRKIP